MAVLSALMWVVGLAAALLYGARLEIWSWGPALVTLGVAGVCAWLKLAQGPKRQGVTLSTLVLGFVICLWFLLRAASSPVRELALQDALLVLAAVACFAVFPAVATQRLARIILFGGMAALVLANSLILFYQHFNPEYHPLFRRAASWPSGLFGHYSYGASFQLGFGFILLGLGSLLRWPLAARLALLFVAILALAGVPFTRSRSGVLALGIGLGVWLLHLSFVFKAAKSRYATAMMVLTPLLLVIGAALAIASFRFVVAERAPEAATGPDTVVQVMDNDIRLHMLSAAVSCIGNHPWLGGGSRSYSWQAFWHWDAKEMSALRASPEHVHNELVQTAVDYGIIGLFLCLALLFFCVASVTIPLLPAAGLRSSEGHHLERALHNGGIAALAALIAQSNFEGIFRILPGTCALACAISACLVCGAPTQRRTRTKEPVVLVARALMLFFAICSLGLVGFGAQASRVLYAPSDGTLLKADRDLHAERAALDAAISRWPLPSLLRQRANVLHTLATAPTTPPDMAKRFFKAAVSDYKQVVTAHPFHAAATISLANVLGHLGEHSAAEHSFLRGIDLQKEAEGTFHAHMMYARYLLGRALALKHGRTAVERLNLLQLAEHHVERSIELSGGYPSMPEDHVTRLAIHEGIAQAHQHLGEHRLALDRYLSATKLRGGGSASYRAAVMLCNLAQDYWNRRQPSVALRLFSEARELVHQSSTLPPDVSPEDKQNFYTFLEKNINFLHGARVEAAADMPF